MLRLLFEGESKCKNFLFTMIPKAYNICHFWLSFRESSRLIEDDSIDSTSNLEWLTSLDEDTILCSFSCPYHDSSRCRKSECTWTGNHDNRSKIEKRCRKSCSEKEIPDCECNHRNDDDSRYKICGYSIRYSLDRSL